MKEAYLFLMLAITVYSGYKQVFEIIKTKTIKNLYVPESLFAILVCSSSYIMLFIDKSFVSKYIVLILVSMLLVKHLVTIFLSILYSKELVNLYYYIIAVSIILIQILLYSYDPRLYFEINYDIYKFISAIMFLVLSVQAAKIIQNNSYKGISLTSYKLLCITDILKIAYFLIIAEYFLSLCFTLVFAIHFLCVMLSNFKVRDKLNRVFTKK